METIMEIRGITKTFPGTTALNNVNLILPKGKVYGPARSERERQDHADQACGGSACSDAWANYNWRSRARPGNQGDRFLSAGAAVFQPVDECGADDQLF